MNRRLRQREAVNLTLLRLAALLLLAVLAFMLYWVVSRGVGVISRSFIFDAPRERMTAGGIWPAIVGTTYVSLGTLLISMPVGIATAIYLNEYAQEGTWNRIIRLAIRNLAGVPSIVYGLFGLGVFAALLRLGTSLAAASLTLSLMTLPWIVTAAEEALRSVPQSFREGSFALGATRWQTIRHQVLPYALPGMATGSILGLARAAGETAPILLTGAAYFLPRLPSSPLDQFMALPYHLYILATQHSSLTQVRPLAYGTALVLLALVMLLNALVIIVRSRARAKKTW
ncbi:MAG TPA: phosphate ABC transporter permease PstA [Sphingobacteriaceae bacterium]|nr:phosphate ABC transporter permease PstA [Sphingobacteriaceae bacterium]